MSSQKINLFRLPEFHKLADQVMAVVVIDRTGNIIASSTKARILLPAASAKLTSHFKPSALAQYKTFLKNKTQPQTTLDVSVKGRAALPATLIRLKGNQLFLVWISSRPGRPEKNDLLVRDFMHTASHQLLTPLTISQWYSQLFLAEADKLDSLPAQFREFIEEIQTANNRMQGVVSLLLDISRLESGKYQPLITRFELKKVIKKALDDYLHKHSEGGVTVEFKSYHQLSCQVRSDKQILAKTLGILLDNAGKYNNSARKIITVSLRRSGVGNIIIAVRDNGTGMNISEQKRIFSKFFRTQSAQNTIPEGNGLSLYYCMLVLKLLGGKIWFRSKPKSGSLFSLRIPA